MKVQHGSSIRPYLVFNHNMASKLFYCLKVSPLAERTKYCVGLRMKGFSVADETGKAAKVPVAAPAGPTDSLAPQVTRQSGRAFR